MSLSADRLTRAYRNGFLPGSRRTVFRDLSLTIRPGETFGLTGNSGAGKSTLGRVIAGLEPPTAGRVCFHGRDTALMNRSEYRAFRRSVQVMFQDPSAAFNPKKTIGTSYLEVLDLIGTPRAAQEAVIAGILESVGLSGELLGRYPHQISGGQSQRLALGRILLLDPEYIVLDEPTSALDVSVQAQILHLLKELQSERGIGYLFISHDEAVVRFMASRVGRIEDGRLVIEGEA